MMYSGTNKSSFWSMPALLCTLFAALYFFFAWRMTDTLVYDYDGLLFETDTAEAAEDITAFQTPNHNETNVHPLFVLLTNPPAQLLQLLFSPTLTVAILNTIWGVLIVLTAYLFFLRAGLSPYRTILWTILTGSSACHMVFVSLPERHIPAAWTITLACLVAILQPVRIWKYVAAGILALGVTVTNFLQCSLLFAVALFVRTPPGPGRWRSFLRRIILYTAATLTGAVLLSLLQKWIWPDTRLFFLPEGYAEESAFFFIPSRIDLFFSKLALLLAHMGLFGFVAPEAVVKWMPDRHMLTFTLDSLNTYSVLGWIALSIWFSFLAMSFVFSWRKPRKWLWLHVVIVLCVVFNIAMHMIYGDDFFLYTPNWTFFILAGVSTAVFTVELSPREQKGLNVLLTILTLAVLGNNYLFMRNLTSYFRNDGSDAWRRWQPVRWQIAQNAGAVLKKNGISTVYTNPRHRWMAFPLNHSARFVYLAYERSPRLKIEAELDTSGYAFLNNEGGITAFLKATQGAATRATVGPSEFIYAIRPPKLRLETMPPGSCAIIRSSTDTNPVSAITDQNLDTFWKGRINEESDDWLEIDLSQGTRIGGLRIFGFRDHIPSSWQIEVKLGTYGEWIPVTSIMPATAYFWSGPKVYWGGRQFRMECRFNPIPGDRIRINFPREGRERVPFVSELEILAVPPDKDKKSFSIPDLLALIQSRDIRRLYSDRWVANQVHIATAGGIQTLIEPHIFEQKRSHRQPKRATLPVPVYFSPATALLVSPGGAPATRECLRQRGFRLRETPVGSGILFDMDPKLWRTEREGYDRIYWNGERCFLANPNAFTKEKAFRLARMAMANFQKGTPLTETVQLLEYALDIHPDSQEALIQLENLRRKQGRKAEAEQIRLRLSEFREPEIRAETDFGNGIRFLGLTVEPPASGETAWRVRYFWKLHPSVEPEKWAVFVHFQHNGKIILQGDHDLQAACIREDVLRQTPDEVFSAIQEQALPETQGSGLTDVFLGVYDKQTEKRLTPRSRLKKKKKGVIIPIALQFNR